MAHQRGDLQIEGDSNYYYIYNSSLAFTRTGMSIVVEVDLNLNDSNPFFPWFVDYSSTKNIEISFEETNPDSMRTIKLEGAYCIAYTEIYNERELNGAKNKFIKANLVLTCNKATIDGASLNSFDIL
jgi:hypothetical protein